VDEEARSSETVGVGNGEGGVDAASAEAVEGGLLSRRSMADEVAGGREPEEAVETPRGGERVIAE